MGTGSNGSYYILQNVHTGWGQGKEPRPIVSCCAGLIPERMGSPPAKKKAIVSEHKTMPDVRPYVKYFELRIFEFP